MASRDTTEVRHALSNFKKKLIDVLPERHKSKADRYIERLIITYYTSDQKVYDKLSKCDPKSFGVALINAAEQGFAIDGRFVYLIPYGDQAEADFSWQALVALARRSGNVEDIRAQSVYETDKFEFQDSNGKQKYKYKPDLSGKRTNTSRVGCYAVATFPSGNYRFEYMDRSELAKVKAASKAPGSPAHQNWGEQMECKSVIKRITKGLIDDPDFNTAIEYDNRHFDMSKILELEQSKSLGDITEEMFGGQRTIEEKPEAEDLTVKARKKEPEPEPVRSDDPHEITDEEIQYRLEQERSR